MSFVDFSPFCIRVNSFGPFAQCNYRVHICKCTSNIWEMSALAFLAAVAAAAADCGLWHVGNNFVLCLTYINNFEVISIACATQMKTRAQLDSFRLCYCGSRCCCCCCCSVWMGAFAWTLHQTTHKTKHRKRRTKNKTTRNHHKCVQI